MSGRQLIGPIVHPTPRTMFQGYQIVHLDKLNANIFVQKKNPCLSYVQSPRSHGNPLSIFK